MYRILKDPQLPKYGRMFVDGKIPIDMGPPCEGDIVTIGVSEDTDFYILVHSVDGDIIKGAINAIGPNPREKYMGWIRGGLIQAEESSIRSIIRRSM